MKPSLSEAFRKAKFEANPELEQSIWLKISTLEARSIKIKFWSYTTSLVLSVVGFIPVLGILLRDLKSSGFYNYFSLLFTDTSALSLYWKELSLVIVESLPALSIMMSLALLFVFFLSLKHLSQKITGPSLPNNRSSRNKLSISF